MPTRVLDIGDSATPPRIFVTHGRMGEYATLSYCWGKDYQQPITTTLNLEHRRTTLYLTSLPPVFQDAIKIVRRLGYRYLWIDSLCILQNSVDDWNAELVKMQQYYIGSSLNIIAAAAEDPTCGIFDSADLLRDGVRYANSHWARFIQGQNFVQTRAWTLQEEILPPRSILYTNGGIYWLCNHESFTETSPALPLTKGRCLHSASHNKLLFNLAVRWDKQYQRALPKQKDEDNERFFYWWYEILNEYVERELSFDRDRLPGIAGLAKEFARRTNAQYLCGLWRESFITGLCWNGNGVRNKSSEYLGPTWSWATVDPMNKDGFRLCYIRHLDETSFLDPDNTAEFVDIHVVNEAQDPYGRVKEGVVILEGPSRKLNTLSDPFYVDSFQGTRGSSDQIRCTLDDQSGYSADSSGFAHPDSIYLRLGRWRSIFEDEPHEIFALLLEPTGKRNVHFSEYIEYRRVGLAEFPPNDELTEGWIKQKVTII
ncbi:hypothetical protein EG329_011472 [Mollisiaceae sp. DMI_Dod_QoI]|nr:hypothetical protein EG329_011472 [Helotiales sp. DMI_Dod_QoI]